VASHGISMLHNEIVMCCFAMQMVVPTADTVRFSYLLETCLDVGRSVLFTGVTGVGKSVITGAALHTLTTASTKNSSQAPESCRVAGRLVAHTLVFSAQTSSSDVQYLIESKLDKKRKKRYAVCRAAGAHHRHRSCEHCWLGTCICTNDYAGAAESAQ